MPHLLSAHSVILYRYLKEHNTTISWSVNHDAEVLGISIAPAQSPVFIKRNSARATSAAAEQSFPWANIVETGGFGHISWYSKDVMPFKHGHVECIALATKEAIKTKEKAIKEVMYFIHQAGADIEHARTIGGKALEKVVKMVRKHIKSHTRESIIASLDPETRVINYEHLNIDKLGLKQIMDYALEGGVIKHKIDINRFADERFFITLEK
jgi:NitT/TauT family transport system substrate-binding protein